MRVEILARFIENLDFVSFKDVAARCIEGRGYDFVADADGWSDGGSDLRVYSRHSVDPVKQAIQTSVEKDWKPKLKADAAKAKRQLHCTSFLYVTSRRIPEALFVPVADDLDVREGVRASKMDQQDIAAFLLQNDLVSWFMGLLGVETSDHADEPKTPAEEARDAFMLFSDESTRFREAMAQHAIETVLARSAAPLERDHLAVRALAALGTSGKAMAGLTRATIDRLLQGGRIVSTGAGLSVSESVQTTYQQARQLVSAQWKAFVRELENVVRRFLPRGSDAPTAAGRLSQEVGALLLKYREYQAALLSSAAIPRTVRQKYTAAVEASRAVFGEIGVHADKLEVCLKAVLDLHHRYPLLDRLSAGEVFRTLLERTPTSLFQVLGGHAELEVVYDTPIAIPMICARLYETVADPHTLAAVRCSEIVTGVGATQLLPDVYLEECASHLIDAGRYAPIFAQLGAKELEGSDNAYASYFARLEGVTFPDFLRTFGYKTDDTEFLHHRDLISARLRSTFKKYGVRVLPVAGHRGSLTVRKRVEQELAHVYHETKEEDRPEILKKHDSQVVRRMVESSSEEDAPAQVVITWDRTLFEVNRTLDSEWWCMDPASAADLLSLGLPGSGASTAVDMFLMVEPDIVKMSGRIWDTIVGFERGNLRDADLLEKARTFKSDFLAKQRPDKAKTAQIIEAWKRWKE